MIVENIKEIIRRKPLIFLLVFFGYFFIAAVFKWHIHPNISTAIFLLGGIVGVYFLDVAEVVFHLTPSPFRSVVFEWAFAVVSLFIISSSGSMLASGLVLSLYLSMILWQIGEWEIHKNLNDWYTMIKGTVTTNTELWIFAGFIVLFIIETFVYIYW